MILGHDFLGLGSKHWKVKETLAAFPQGWALGCFARTFGDALPNVRKFLESGKVSAFRLQAYWDPGHKLVPLEVLRKELPRWEALANEFPMTKFYISFSCEYRSKDKAKVKACIELTKSICPSCTVIQTPEGGSVTISGYMVEEHGEHAKAGPNRIASTDGMSIMDIDAEKWLKKNSEAHICFLWGARYNLRESGPFVDPKKRTGAPNGKYVEGLNRLTIPQGEAPILKNGSGVVVPVTAIKRPMLWKSFAEDSPGDKDKRDNRPVFLIEEKVGAVKIVGQDLVSLGKLPLYKDPKPHDIERYYSGVPGGVMLLGWELGDLALSRTGLSWVWLKVGKRFYGPICPRFRTGYFQKEK